MQPTALIGCKETSETPAQTRERDPGWVMNTWWLDSFVVQAAAAANINIQERKKKNLKQELKRQDSVPDNLFKKAGGVRERDHPSCGSNSVKCVIHYSINFFLPFYFFLEALKKKKRWGPIGKKERPSPMAVFSLSLFFISFSNRQQHPGLSPSSPPLRVYILEK